MRPVSDILQSRVNAGEVTADPAQAEAAVRLDAVLGRLGKARKKGWFSKPEPAIGLYLWGGVGRGKSMLMDLFFEQSTVPARRVHFHEFMGRVHEDLFAARARKDVSDPIPPVAKKLSSSVRLLCFDEFQVTQIADAMILSRLFEQLFARGVTVVATSNRHPDDLYKHGINRELFLPFIELLKTRCEVFELQASRDYRLERLREAPVWHVGTHEATQPALSRAFDRLTLGAQPKACTLMVKGRHLKVEREAAGVVRFTFEELCDRPLGALDYLTIAATFHTVILEDIPKLSVDKRNQAARFVALIDALYEAKVKLIASAEADPEALYPQGDGSFEFQRTVSRLHEMASLDYMAEAHKLPDISA
ncbi:MAG: cell division protein ZapE [Pseudomonadota bacterium]